MDVCNLNNVLKFFFLLLFFLKRSCSMVPQQGQIESWERQAQTTAEGTPGGVGLRIGRKRRKKKKKKRRGRHSSSELQKDPFISFFSPFQSSYMERCIYVLWSISY
eukprot:TRINITY_DN5646_c2_g1_i1.p1 TRINITY_DN5646_c2_g1~~TRINITY_DN5646_c2_g1_i1.p1  ORF type:complete len:106 (-),score=8.62 TRINITY_DN5646_c2_g1_i1:221-538(-)